MAPLVSLVDKIATLDLCIADIAHSSQELAPLKELAIDLEGVNLCRHGKISLLQIFAYGSETIWIVDVTVLGSVAFDHCDPHDRSLRGIMQGSETRKIFYDVRADADAMFNIYGVHIANVYDLQVLEVAVRRTHLIRAKFLVGLSKAIQEYASPPAQWLRVKESGVRLFAPEHGGTYEVFERRPIDEKILAYAAQDVVLLFRLKDVLESKMLGLNWRMRMLDVSEARVNEAKAKTFVTGRHMAIAPIF